MSAPAPDPPKDAPQNAEPPVEEPQAADGSQDAEGSTGGGKKKKKVNFQSVWAEAKDLVWQRRGRLLAGFGLIVLARLAGLVTPASSKFVVDEVLTGGRAELLAPLAIAIGAAAVVQAASNYSLAMLLSVTAQRAIAEMRKSVQQHVIRLPVDYFDSTKSGILISRVMSDAEGIRNLVGTGLVQLVGGLITATLSLIVLFYLNWQMTVLTMVVLLGFGGMMAVAFKRLRPLFRERGELNAQVTGRLGESLGGVRVVKAYTAEKREDLVFAKGAHTLFRNVARTIRTTSAVSAGASLLFGMISVIMITIGGRAILAGSMTLGDFVSYIFFTGMVAMPMVQISSIGTQITEAFAGLDRI
ncbi:MAG: ABC transporter ATP-binding protein, partial [Acidobacteriota bacterium]